MLFAPSPPCMQSLIVADETHHCRIISKLNDVVGAETGSAVMGEQAQQQGA